MSYQAKVYMQQGAAKEVVASGGTIEVQSGGIIDVLTGGIIKANGTQAAHIADVATAGSATAAANATAINAILVVLEGAGLVATS